MPLIRERNAVLDLFAEASDRRWVLPAFNTENQTTTEAILAAGLAFAETHGMPDIPVYIGITNRYFHRAQSENYTHTGRWDLGLALFLGDLETLTAAGSPYERLRVLVHLDHIQWDADAPFLAAWDPARYSSIMFDASTLPFEENLRRTAEFTEANRRRIVIEGACDEIREASEAGASELTTPDMAERYLAGTGVDLIVANLGTEHRASAAELRYRDDRARAIAERVGPRLCLHGTSSVPPDQVRRLFDDGIRKVNLWTALERDSTPVLFRALLEHAAGAAGVDRARAWFEEGLLGPRADRDGPHTLDYFTTHYRQHLVFEAMKRIALSFMELWYT